MSEYQCEWVDGQARCRMPKGHPGRHETDSGRLLMDPVLPPSDNLGRCRSKMPERGLQCQMNRDHTADHHMNGGHRWETCTNRSPGGRRCLGVDRHPGLHHCEDSSTGQASSWTNYDLAAYCQSKFRGTKCLSEAGHTGLHANSPSFWSSERQDFADGSGFVWHSGSARPHPDPHHHPE